MVKSAAEKGLLDERAAVFEIMTALETRRADIIITYWRAIFAQWVPGVISTKVKRRRNTRLKRLAFVWAQAQGFSACAMEVSFRSVATVADSGPRVDGSETYVSTAVFECNKHFAICGEIIVTARPASRRLYRDLQAPPGS